MKNKRLVNWLISELPELIQNKIISNDSAEKIQKYYESRVSNRNIALTIFSVIGVTLITLGIISLLAYNWSELSRGVRAVISIAPLAAAISLGYILIKRELYVSKYTESLGIFWTLSIGLAISLISQTYHIQGDFERFLIVWSLLSLPLIYLLRSSVVFILYLAGITWWAGYAQVHEGNAIMFWLLLLPALPFYFAGMKLDKYSNSVLWMSWMLVLALTVAIGTVLEKCVPGLWIIVYSSFFTVLYLLGAMIYNDSSNLHQMPFQMAGFAGSAVLSFMLTYEWAWEDIGWNYYRSSGRFHEWAGFGDYIFAIGLPILAALLLMRSIKLKKEVVYEFGLAPVLAILCYLTVSGTKAEVISMSIFNAYFLVLSTMVIIRGVKYNSMKILNAGMIMFAMLIVGRFFDIDIGFIARGVIFILLGSAFLGGNIYMSKRKAGK